MKTVKQKLEAIKQFGIERIVSECKKIVKKFNKTWIEVDDLLGMWNSIHCWWTFNESYFP